MHRSGDAAQGLFIPFVFLSAFPPWWFKKNRLRKQSSALNDNPFQDNGVRPCTPLDTQGEAGRFRFVKTQTGARESPRRFGADNEYRSNVPGIYQLKLAGKEAETLATKLFKISEEEMGTRLTMEFCMKVAEKIARVEGPEKNTFKSNVGLKLVPARLSCIFDLLIPVTK